VKIVDSQGEGVGSRRVRRVLERRGAEGRRNEGGKQVQRRVERGERERRVEGS
jgi:hypothetical protein